MRRAKFSHLALENRKPNLYPRTGVWIKLASHKIIGEGGIGIEGAEEVDRGQVAASRLDEINLQKFTIYANTFTTSRLISL